MVTHRNHIGHIVDQMRHPSRAGRLGDAWCLFGGHALWPRQRHTGPCVCFRPTPVRCEHVVAHFNGEPVACDRPLHDDIHDETDGLRGSHQFDCGDCPGFWPCDFPCVKDEGDRG